ncbi:hypothetical protein SKP52_01120 [Sphingopyxis fribergensis]|uniref:HTH tetR-type domain-containing protein n=1 Tax=Sphingopyxis fribergensis TaxID=1515612 RepID=A0A0A7PAT7_9SPHN|nr:hypothetical protein SKP52_01120 [Sphingopyxis fribergensis]
MPGRTRVENDRRGRGRPRHGLEADSKEVARVAFAAFAASGYEGASLREIASKANVDPALVSRRYGSKLGLWKSTVDELARRMAAVHTPIAELCEDGSSYPARLRIALRKFVAFSTEVPELGRFFADEVAKPGERRDYILEHIWRPHFDTVQPLMREACDTGLVEVDDPDFLVFLLIGMVAMPLMMNSVIKDELGVDDTQLAERLSRSVERLFLGG